MLSKVNSFGLCGIDGFLTQIETDIVGGIPHFEIVGLGAGDLAKGIGVKKNFRGRTDVALKINGKDKCPYSRISEMKIEPHTITVRQLVDG